MRPVLNGLAQFRDGIPLREANVYAARRGARTPGIAKTRLASYSICLLWLVSLGAPVSAGDERYRDDIEKWRQKRVTDLKAEDGWLSVTGLYWLRPGETKVGSDPSNDLLLPDRLPGLVGTFALSDGKVDFQPAPQVAVARNGTQFKGGRIYSDADLRPDTLALRDVKLILLKRGERYAVRIKDNQSALRASFAGLRWYPSREEWRIQATFVPYALPTKLKMDTIVGETEIMDSPGYVTFERAGKTYRLEAAGQKNGTLWFVFRDGTSGRTTHGGARQLYADLPKQGSVLLDFNKAVNLPCAYIPYATCPLAPAQNRLSLAIEAGEMKYEAAREDGSSSESHR
jgi:hypothetical protein